MLTNGLRILRTILLAGFGAALGFGNSVTFSVIPSSSLAGLQPNDTSGWGYSIENTTSYFVVPMGLSNSGVLFGALLDIFDYPVVDPGQVVSQNYVYNAPGGWGNSLGLFEYTMPGGVPAGLDQSGVITFAYQLYDDNPDLNFNAAPVGGIETLTAGFDVVAGDATPAPEPSTWQCLGVLLVVAGARGMRRAAGRRAA